MDWIPGYRKRLPLHVTLYSKPGCHLCDEAVRVLKHLSKRYALVLEEIDIRSDPALFRRFDVRIPVLVFEDGTTVEAPVREQELQHAIKKNVRRS